MPTDHNVPYRIYLLTCWPDAAEARADPETWRFRVEEPQRGRRHGYIGVKALIAGLVALINSDEHAGPAPR